MEWTKTSCPLGMEICDGCGGNGGCPGSDFGDYGWHACYKCGELGYVPEGTAAREASYVVCKEGVRK